MRHMFEWNPTYSVRVSEMDSQHQQLFRIAGELHTAMAAGQAKGAMESTLQRLIAYTRQHFESEERLMARVGYPGWKTHKVEHDRLTRQVERFEADFQC